MFEDRSEAGRRLAAVLEDRGVKAGVVLAVPRGGLPIGRAVADALELPLDVVVAGKIGAPGNAELAIGAVASDGTAWLNDRIVEDLSVGEGFVEEAIEREREAAAEKLRRYRGDRPAPDLAGKIVVVVDDGVATGATVTACLRRVRDADAERVVLAVPVAPPRAVERLRSEGDKVIAVETPSRFGAVGQYYRSFDQVTDDEAKSYLDWG